jgi:hypothetical protein
MVDNIVILNHVSVSHHIKPSKWNVHLLCM